MGISLCQQKEKRCVAAAFSARSSRVMDFMRTILIYIVCKIMLPWGALGQKAKQNIVYSFHYYHLWNLNLIILIHNNNNNNNSIVVSCSCYSIC